MSLRSCRWTPLGPYSAVRVPPAVAGGRSAFVADPAFALLAEGNEVFVATRAGIWRRSDRPLGPWVRATEHVDVGDVVLVAGRPIFTVLHRGVIELVADDVPAVPPPGTVHGARLFNGDPGHEVLIQTTSGVMISRDGGGTFDPLWPGRTIGSAAWIGSDTWIVSESSSVRLATGSTLAPTGVAVLPNAVALGLQLFITIVSTPADRNVVWAVFSQIGITNDSLTLFAVFVTTNGGSDWSPVIAPRSTAAQPNAAFYVEHNGAAFSFGRLPAAVDPLDPDRLIFGLDHVWEVRRGGSPTVLVAQQMQAYALAVTEARVWATTEDGVLSIDRIPAPASRFVARDRGRGPPQPTLSGTHHQDLAPVVAAASMGGGILRSRAHPVWVRVDPHGVEVAIRESLRQFLVAGFGGLEAANDFIPPLRPLHRGESTPQLARAPSDERIAWFGGRRLFRLEGDVVRPVVEFDRHNPTSEFMTALSVSPSDPNRVFVLMPSAIVQVDFRATGSTASPIPLPTSTQGRTRSIAAGVTDPGVVYLTVGVPRTSVPGSEPRIWRWDPGVGQWRDLTATVGAPGQTTPLTAVAALSQPGGPDRILVGGEGVWETRDLGVTWVAIGEGLPGIGVNALAVHEKGRRLRAFTGRGVFERNLDLPPCTATPHEVELYLRSHDLDDGARVTPLVDPFDGKTLTFEDAAGLRVDARAAPKAGEPATFQQPVDLPEWGMDPVAFQQLENRDVIAGARARVWVEAHNRGPDDASPLCWVAWAPLENGALPSVQSSFWQDFPGDALFSGPWKVAGVRTIPRLRPGVPEVVRIDWDVPQDAPRHVGLIAVLHSDEDSVFEGINRGAMERDPTALARANRRVLVRKVKVAPGPPPRVDPAEPKEPGEPPEESKLGYWIAGAVVVALIVLGAVWIRGRRND